MKNFLRPAAAAVLLLTAVSCEDFLSSGEKNGGKAGTLAWQFDPVTKAAEAFPDTNQFLLSIADAQGNSVYDGRYGDSPEVITVREGSYTIAVRSTDFSAPRFDAPLYGDTRVAIVKAGATTRVSLACTMLNSGLRLKVSPSFFQAYPAGALTLSSADGELGYDYDEERIAYFLPGDVTLLLRNGEASTPLFVRRLEAREILTVGLTVPEDGSSPGMTGAGVSISVDTAKVWQSEVWSPEQGGPGSSKESAMDVTRARAAAGATGVWVYGYIVGGDLSSTGSRMNTGPAFEKDTHLAIAVRSSVTDKASCLSVELPKGAVRDALNLKDHPEMLGRQVFLKGDLVTAYFGIPGLKNVKEFSE